MESSLHFSLEIGTQNDDKCNKRKHGKGKQNDQRPTVLIVIKVQCDQRTDDGNKNEIDQREHIVLLCFQVGKKEHDATRESTKTHNRNDKQGKAMHKQLVNYHQQNTAPNRNFDGLADAVEFHKVGGEGKRPYNVKPQNDDNAPKRTLDTKIDNECGCGYSKERPADDG